MKARQITKDACTRTTHAHERRNAHPKVCRGDAACRALCVCNAMPGRLSYSASMCSAADKIRTSAIRGPPKERCWGASRNDTAASKGPYGARECATHGLCAAWSLRGVAVAQPRRAY